MGIGMSIEPALFGSSLVYYTTAYGPDGYYLLNQSAYQTTPINIYLPINVNPTFRLEPVFGIYAFRDEQTITTPATQYSSLQITTSKSEVTLTHLALGGFYLVPAQSNFQMYVGPRVGLNFVSSLSTDYYFPGRVAVRTERETNEIDFVAGINFGAEYYASKEFSLGGEMDANYVFFGNPDVAYTPPPVPTSSRTERKRHVIASGALFFLRWYFVSGE